MRDTVILQRHWVQTFVAGLLLIFPLLASVHCAINPGNSKLDVEIMITMKIYYT